MSCQVEKMATRYQPENEPVQPKNRSVLSDGIRNCVDVDSDVKWPTTINTDF